MITREIFQSYLDCKYKAFLKMSTETVPSQPNDFAQLNAELESKYRQTTISRLFPASLQSLGLNQTTALMRKGQNEITDAQIGNQRHHATIDMLEKAKGKSDFGSHHYQPVLCTQKRTANTSDRTLLGFLSLNVADLQNFKPIFGKIISGSGFRSQRVRLVVHAERARQIVGEIESKTFRPRLRLNPHCKQCEFMKSCQSLAKERDDLSLLSGMDQKEVEKLHRKGIFTVTQLSHIFRGMRRHKRQHSFALKSLAIRDQKTFIYNCPSIPEREIQVYLDVESLPNEDFYYLIGILIIQGQKAIKHQFWANTKSEEIKIFESFLAVLEPLSNYNLFHYGSFELKFLKNMANRAGRESDETFQRAIGSSINILEYIYFSVYFPTYSNDLKSISNFLGFKWTHVELTGLQSIVLRKQWEKGRDQNTKDILRVYNAEDCEALRIVTQTIQILTSPGSDPLTAGISAEKAEDLKRTSSGRWGKIEFAIPAMKEISQRAYFDYQKTRVYAREGKRPKLRLIAKPKSVSQKPNQTIHLVSRKCRRCKSSDIKKAEEICRTVVDLKFNQYGAKRWIVKYVSWIYHCDACAHRSYPKNYKRSRKHGVPEKYGSQLAGWIIYQHFVNNISFRMIQKSLMETFRINVSLAWLYECKTRAFELYSVVFEEEKRRLLSGNVIVADEAKIKLRDVSGFAWVFANSQGVIFIFKETREGEFLKDFLKDFKGVIVSDFYAAYDSLPCQQQKCLIHLIRDINGDLIKAPFDEELKDVAQTFTILIREIVGTIDMFGLKKRRLARHKPSIKQFFKTLEKRNFSSEFAKKYQRRFLKSRDRLFTFINHDGVPWNSNAAEHAIKHLAEIRSGKGLASHTKSHIDEYMQLISVYQTCEYRDISFLRFLLSGKKTL